MAFCTNCGSELKGGKFCTVCGAAVETETFTEEKTYTQAQPEAAPQPQKAGLNVKMLVWSIINTVLCCQVLGIVALVLTILAGESTDIDGAKKYIKIAKILNIVGAVCMALYVIFMIIYVIVMIVFGGLMSLGVMSALTGMA